MLLIHKTVSIVVVVLDNSEAECYRGQGRRGQRYEVAGRRHIPRALVYKYCINRNNYFNYHVALYMLLIQA